MRKAFTLVEMLIVVVVLVTLMTIAFRLSSIGSDQTRRNATITRLQRVENCLSGYMAAFGTYPPVRMQGSRNIYVKMDSSTGLQDIDGQENKSLWGWSADTFRTYVSSDFSGKYYQSAEASAWRQVRAACRAQPVDCQFPFTQDFDGTITKVSEILKQKAESANVSQTQKDRLNRGFSNLTIGGIPLSSGEDWRETQVFQFGLMSYLLPRFLFMISYDDSSAQHLFELKQWTSNNTLPQNPFNPNDTYEWRDISQRAQYDVNTKQYAEIASIPSQAICARWISNLEGICSCNYKMNFFGITVSPIESDSGLSSTLQGDNMYLDIYENNGQRYILDSVTIHDGWGHEVYYYSPSPYQTYTLWSAGPNGRTFPPWVDRNDSDLKGAASDCIGAWIEDDIIHMSN